MYLRFLLYLLSLKEHNATFFLLAKGLLLMNFFHKREMIAQIKTNLIAVLITVKKEYE